MHSNTLRVFLVGSTTPIIACGLPDPLWPTLLAPFAWFLFYPAVFITMGLVFGVFG